MCQISVQIEDLLHSSDYKTERIGGIINVHDPVHQVFSGSTELVVTHFKLKEIRSISQARSFINVRQ